MSEQTDLGDSSPTYARSGPGGVANPPRPRVNGLVVPEVGFWGILPAEGVLPKPKSEPGRAAHEEEG